MYCNVCNRYREFKKSKISYIFKKHYGQEYKKIFKEEDLIEI